MARPQKRRQRRLWTKDEDEMLIHFLFKYPDQPFTDIVVLARLAGLDRDYKSCWERYNNQLKPSLKGNFTQEEDEIIIRFHSTPGDKWTYIRDNYLQWRTANDIKNHYNNHLKKKPATSTHQNTPDTQIFQLNQNTPTASSSSIVTSVAPGSHEIINSGSSMAGDFINSNETNFEGDDFANWNSSSPKNEFMPTEEVTKYWS